MPITNKKNSCFGIIEKAVDFDATSQFILKTRR